MYKRENLNGKELVRKALTCLSVVMINKECNLRVLYQKNKEGYLCVIQKLGDKTKPNPIQVSRPDYHTVLKKALSEKWKLMLFDTKKVITEDVDIDEISKLLD